MRMKLTNFFKVDPAVGLSKFRISLLRFYYVLMILVLGIDVWTAIFNHMDLWEPMTAVGYSLWATFAVLSIIGLMHPVKMIPIILLNITYKIIWLSIVAYPLWNLNQLEGSDAEGLTKSNFIGFIIDIIIIPWVYVFKNYILVSKKNNM
ncbi:hypothetical protein [Zunongwangia pacifica]|uniref:Uncharacterized protein n=1 Tax=Zunongwangia pacifica TaxID=2911062 RepID=A0A9X1ZTC6_9FLAO|nr:hypothetical protein [Zunongwangia pacifica]MCL6220657.1 hypothetical protein [Zunongwangia pacifica]